MAKLIAATNINFGRLVDCSVRLDEKVIAVVGPNEAGKTTFLKALEFATNDNPSDSSNSPRLDNSSDACQITLRYLLTEEDKQSLKSAYMLDIIPNEIKVTKHSDGSKRFLLIPEPEIKAKLFKYTRQAVDKANLDEESKNLLQTAVEASDTHRNLAPEDYTQALQEFEDAGYPKEAQNLRETIRSLDGQLIHKVRNTIMKTLPKCYLFDDENRNLPSSFPIDTESQGPFPAAIENLLELAGTTSKDLVQAILHDETYADTLIEKSNRVLQERFGNAWNQSPIEPRLKYADNRLTIQFISPTGEITRFDSRSTGLRTFVALLAFIYSKGANENSILLIDEAENHLHVDAQVKLVDTFVEQEIVGKIIYTTHSPACLPPDFGNAIKAIVPNPDNDYRSNITANLIDLSDNEVFPISYAMGAMTSVMSAMKAAVVVEGSSDSILLPTLIKKAADIDRLPYRIVPGLAQINPNLYAEYEKLASQVAYLLDGDKDGQEYKNALMSIGIHQNRIFTLPNDRVLEDLIDIKLIKAVYKSLLADEDLYQKSLHKVTHCKNNGDWINKMNEIIEKEGRRGISKPAIAYNLLDQSESLELNKEARQFLQRIHSRMTAAG